MKMKILLSLIAIAGCYLVAFTDIKHKDVQTVSVPLEITIKVPVEKVSMVDLEPVIDTTNKDTFVSSLNACVDYIYKDLPVSQHIPKEILIAQSVLETGWGSSRFANEGNNLFGIRTFNKDSKWLLPITWDQTKWIGWGVKVYETRCDSVKDYVRILNEVFAYEEFRLAREEGADVYQLADTLTAYATRKNYTTLIKQVIKHNIVGVYEL